MGAIKRHASLALAVVLAAVSVAPAWAAPVLVKVVMVSRHGVRSPTQTAEALRATTGRAWPAWSVAPGELTAQGRLDLRLMAQYLRARYAAYGLLAKRCPTADVLQIWADGADDRTRESGTIIAAGFALGCAIVPGHVPAGEHDPLFGAASICPMRPDEAVAAVKARLGESPDESAALVGPAAGAVEAARTVLGPQACKAVDAACLTGLTSLVAGKGAPKLEGPLEIAAGLGENLLLEYADGMAADQVGWGAGSAATVATVLGAHERSADLLRRTPYIAAHNGFVMARTVLDLLQDKAPTDPHAPPLSPGARVTMIAGHDTNLSNLAGVFGLDWRLPDQPDSTAPDTTLAFELWREPSSGVLSVHAVVYSQSLAQLRDATPLDAAHPAGVTPVAFEGCATPDGACPLTRLVEVVSKRLPRDCFTAADPADRHH